MIGLSLFSEDSGDDGDPRRPLPIAGALKPKRMKFFVFSAYRAPRMRVRIPTIPNIPTISSFATLLSPETKKEGRIASPMQPIKDIDCLSP
jgi:hypothetical protein